MAFVKAADRSGSAADIWEGRTIAGQKFRESVQNPMDTEVL